MITFRTEIMLFITLTLTIATQFRNIRYVKVLTLINQKKVYFHSGRWSVGRRRRRGRDCVTRWKEFSRNSAPASAAWCVSFHPVFLGSFLALFPLNLRLQRYDVHHLEKWPHFCWQQYMPSHGPQIQHAYVSLLQQVLQRCWGCLSKLGRSPWKAKREVK